MGQFKKEICFLQEAKLSLLPMKDCAKFKKSLKVDIRKEMCAGHKIFRRIDAYRRLSSKSRKKRKIFKRLPKSARKRDYEVRYGRTDSCAGDSGAMLPDIVEKKFSSIKHKIIKNLFKKIL